jgi:hypothetical protein
VLPSFTVPKAFETGETAILAVVTLFDAMDCPPLVAALTAVTK